MTAEPTVLTGRSRNRNNMLSPVPGYRNATHIGQAWLGQHKAVQATAPASSKEITDKLGDVGEPLDMPGDGARGA